jgi:2'-5' RNA ligase
LTLARVKGRPPAALLDWLRRETATAFGAVQISSLEFLRSELQPSGARYTTLSEHALGNVSEPGL